MSCALDGKNPECAMENISHHHFSVTISSSASLRCLKMVSLGASSLAGVDIWCSAQHRLSSSRSFRAKLGTVV